MIHAYLNYPNPHMTLHNDSACPEIGKMAKVSQRSLPVTQATITQVLVDISSNSFRLGATASINDVWFAVDLGDPEFEEAVARYIHRILAHRYTPLRGSPIEQHC